ncbi:MAG: hypothetical protein JXB48_23580 [Candidatus Latescibacteria bacterium]|nr:hypothetical protein [Candidatus Latescibacterota bacterium]
MNVLRVFIVLSMIYVSSTKTVRADQDGWYTEGGNYTPTKRIKVTLTNTLDIDRENCPVVIERQRFPFFNFSPPISMQHVINKKRLTINDTICSIII